MIAALRPHHRPSNTYQLFSRDTPMHAYVREPYMLCHKEPVKL
jgi:hypothetical protein